MVTGRPQTALRIVLSVVVAVVGLSQLGLAETELLVNPGFEAPAESGLPPGWQIFAGQAGVQLLLEKERVASGAWSFTIVDNSSTGGYGIRSTPLPAEPGQTYRASVKAMTENGGRAYLYLDYWNKNRTRIAHQTMTTKNAEWINITVSFEAPPDTAWVSIILYSSSTDVGTARFDDASLQLMDADSWTGADVDLSAGEESMDYSPAHGGVVTTNPPSFVWLPIAGATTYNLEYSTDPEFKAGNTAKVDDIDISIYTPAAPFDSKQTWYWRVQGVDRKGITSPYTIVRAFNIASNAVELPLPPLAEVRALLPAAHPRLFITPETLPQWREKRNSDMLLRLLWSDVSGKAVTARLASLPAEPPNCRPGGVWDVNLWRQYTITTGATDKMEALAFAYLMTGDKETGEAARKWMLHIASWDPKGATSAAINDESSLPILYQMSRAYTWAYDALTPADREFIRGVMRIRGNEAYQILKRLPFESRPYSSHAGRSLGFLGETAIAFMGEIPEAAEWFDYVVRIFYAIYPAWGKDPGGWAEGHAYWTSYMNRVFWFVDAFQVATGLDLYKKAFFQNTGTFKLYTQPPYSKMGPFGDFADRGPVSSDGSVMGHLAAVYNNPYYRWYADRLGATVEMGVMGFIRAALYNRTGLKSMAPTNLPSSAYFPDIGWVVFHKLLGEPKDAIQFMFKSSPYGSYSHSFADQNTFTLEAYGEPLAISSGYRPWYGSEHHMKWTKTTQAHNGILVNGQGQQVQSLASKGEILGFLNGQSFDYTAGDAGQAYGKTLVERYVRHAVYLRPDLFVLYDDIKAPKESNYSWLLHTYHEMKVDESAHQIQLNAGNARLDTRLWSSSSLAYSQTDQFATPLDEPMNKPVQWHLTATTQEAAREAYFLAVLAPGKAADTRLLQAERVAAGAGEGVRLHYGDISAVVLFRRGEGTLATAEVQSDGTVAAWRWSGDGSQGLLMAGGAHWQSAQGLQLTATAVISAELTLSAASVVGTLVYPAVPGSAPYDVTLKLPGRSVKAVTSTLEILHWEADGDTLKMRLTPGEHKLTITLG